MTGDTGNHSWDTDQEVRGTGGPVGSCGTPRRRRRPLRPTNLSEQNSSVEDRACRSEVSDGPHLDGQRVDAPKGLPNTSLLVAKFTVLKGC